MGEGPTTRSGATRDGTAVEPTLVLTFAGRGNGGTQRCRIPPVGLLLGRNALVFDEPFDDSRMSARHAELRIDGGKVLVRDLGSETGTRLNGHVLGGERALEAENVAVEPRSRFAAQVADEDLAAVDPQLRVPRRHARVVKRLIEDERIAAEEQPDGRNAAPLRPAVPAPRKREHERRLDGSTVPRRARARRRTFSHCRAPRVRIGRPEWRSTMAGVYVTLRPPPPPVQGKRSTND